MAVIGYMLLGFVIGLLLTLLVGVCEYFTASKCPFTHKRIPTSGSAVMVIGLVLMFAGIIIGFCVGLFAQFS